MTPPADARRFQVLIETWRARLTPEGWHDESAESCADDLEAELAAVSSSQTWQPDAISFTEGIMAIIQGAYKRGILAPAYVHLLRSDVQMFVQSIFPAPPASEPDK